MKSILRYGILLLAVTILLGALAGTEAKAQATKISALYTMMDNHRQQLKTLKASISMIKYNTQLDEKSVYEGSLIYLPVKDNNPYVRIDWTKPIKETLAIKDGRFKAYRPGVPSLVEGDAQKKVKQNTVGGSLDFLNMSKEQLRDNFSASLLAPDNLSGGTPAYHLKLEPKNKAGYEYAEVWIDGDGMPLQFRIIEKNKDSTTVRLYNLQKNVKVSKKEFEIQTPKKLKPTIV